ncbi:hypothetical protein [Streptomyces sp. NPDC007100]|uniref:hypothetical protein n=1 Tax=Streptomyces sp. NPDC007100 TaxID=3155602 RepID=UPI0033EACCA8
MLSTYRVPEILAEAGESPGRFLAGWSGFVATGSLKDERGESFCVPLLAAAVFRATKETDNAVGGQAQCFIDGLCGCSQGTETVGFSTHDIRDRKWRLVIGRLGSACEQPFEVVAHRGQFFLGGVFAPAELRGDVTEEHVRNLVQDDLHAENARGGRLVEHKVSSVETDPHTARKIWVRRAVERKEKERAAAPLGDGRTEVLQVEGVCNFQLVRCDKGGVNRAFSPPPHAWPIPIPSCDRSLVRAAHAGRVGLFMYVPRLGWSVILAD